MTYTVLFYNRKIKEIFAGIITDTTLCRVEFEASTDVEAKLKAIEVVNMQKRQDGFVEFIGLYTKVD